MADQSDERDAGTSDSEGAETTCEASNSRAKPHARGYLAVTDFGDETPPKRKLVQREWRGQEASWAFLQKALPYGCLSWGIDQAAKRSRAANRARLDRGCKPGVGDCYILWKGVTLWLEEKRGAEHDLAQKEFGRQVIANNGFYAVVKSPEDVEAACRAAGIPLRASLGDVRSRIAAQNERLPPKRKTGSRRVQTGDTMSVAAYHRAHGKGFL